MTAADDGSAHAAQIAETERRHRELQHTDAAITEDITLEQYRATNARLKAALAERDTELSEARDTLADLRGELSRAAVSTAATAETIASLKVAVAERDRLAKRVEQLLASRSWRLGHAVLVPMSRLSGRR